MKIVELLLLAITYTALIIALFLEILCYKRKIETKETIAFTFSLLLLVVSLSLSGIFETNEENPTFSLSTLICMIIVSVTTFLNILSERQHKINPWFKRGHLVASGLLLIATLTTYFFGGLIYVQNAVVGFLIASVVGSMLITLRTKPQKRYAHQEKAERIFAIAFLTLVPLYLILHFGFEEQYAKLKIGFLIPIVFTFLASHKIYDDLQRLSLIKREIEPQKQKISNYKLTKREEEIVGLLLKGFTYQKISEQLFISLSTVKTHASNIYKKTGVKTRHELTSLLID